MNCFRKRLEEREEEIVDLRGQLEGKGRNLISLEQELSEKQSQLALSQLRVQQVIYYNNESCYITADYTICYILGFVHSIKINDSMGYVIIIISGSAMIIFELTVVKLYLTQSENCVWTRIITVNIIFPHICLVTKKNKVHPMLANFLYLVTTIVHALDY